MTARAVAGLPAAGIGGPKAFSGGYIDVLRSRLVWRDADGVHRRSYVLLLLLGRTQLWARV